MPEILKGRIISNKQMAKDIYLLTLKLEKKVNPQPGQFFMLKITQGLNPLLPRPFSWFEISDSGKEVKFLYQIVGRGTELLSQKIKGEPISLLGPLGRGFNLKPARGKVYLIAGGVGVGFSTTIPFLRSSFLICIAQCSAKYSIQPYESIRIKSDHSHL